MLRNRILFIGLAVVVAAVSSCIFDPDPAPDPVEPKEEFKPLTKKENVLNNIQVSYNKRRIDKYDELLDVNFTFFLSTGDVGGGLPESWGRAEEIQYNTSLFDPNYTGENRCKRISMDLQFETGVQWVEVVPPNFPEEVWYTTTVFYDFRFEMEPDNTYISVPGSKAQFTVRNTGTVDAPLWKLVEMRDLGEAN
jgi:hypothetical protein